MCELHSAQTFNVRIRDQHSSQWLSTSLSQLFSRKLCQLHPWRTFTTFALMLVHKNKTRTQPKTHWLGCFFLCTCVHAHLQPILASVLLHLPGGIASPLSPGLSSVIPWVIPPTLAVPFGVALCKNAEQLWVNRSFSSSQPLCMNSSALPSSGADPHLPTQPLSTVFCLLQPRAPRRSQGVKGSGF